MKEDNTRIHAFRLQPGDDLKKSLQNFVQECQITSAWIVTAVGSLTQYSLRFANQSQPSFGKGFFEILALSGTVGADSITRPANWWPAHRLPNRQLIFWARSTSRVAHAGYPWGIEPSRGLARP